MEYDIEPAAADHSAACAASEVLASDQLKMRRFLQWLQEQGATFPSMSIKVGQGSRQVHATQALKAGELVARIPHNLTITPQLARESEVGRLIARHGSNIDDDAYLAAYLLQVRLTGGFWRPYIDILPADYSALPLCFSKAELDELKGSYHLNSILSRIGRHAYTYDQLPPCLKEKGYTREAFTWAKCVVMTRMHGTKIDGRPIRAMVPLSDMFNHADQNNAAWSAEAEGGFFIRAEHAIETGAALFERYGRCNARLLDEYGFCLEDNPNNVAEVRLQPLTADHPYFNVTGKLGAQQWNKRTFKVGRGYLDNGAKALFSYLRLACLCEPQHALHLRTDEDNAAHMAPISRQNEIAALRMLADACENRIAQFHTSLEEDETLLQGGSLTHNLRNIVMVRRDEKIILKYFLTMAQSALPLLQHGPRDLDKFAVAGMPYADYFADLIHSAI